MANLSKTLRVLAFLLAIFIVSSSSLKAEAKDRIGYVDTAAVLEKYPKAQKALADLKASEEVLRNKLIEQRRKFAQPENQKKTETEKRLLLEKFKADIEPEAERLEEKSKKKSKEIENEMEAAIKTVANSAKYDLILIKQAVLWGGKDVSNEVIKELSKK